MPARDDASGQASLNDNHRRHLLASCQYIDRLLSDADNIVTATDTASPFARYVNDLSPVMKTLVRDYFRKLRQEMLRILERHGSMPPSDRISAVYALRTTLGFVDISIEELKPEYIRGYGAVPDVLVPEINGFVEELQSIVRALDAALSAGQAGDVQQRLAQLEAAGADVSVLSRLERIVAEHGLVEFRPALDIALSRLEDQRFEIAIFGRVSAGKSSLLNHLLDGEILPVGVNPITAVPTRVMCGETPGIEVHFADRKPESTPLETLRDYVTEAQNPANAKHVTRLIVRVPAARLSDGIVFVDTPGLGSLATSGAAETLAYLPRCDFGVVLIDAASTLTQEDVQTVHLLQQAGIPAMVVLSKADLLNEHDRQRAVEYARTQLSAALGQPIDVQAVSTAPGHESLLDTWIGDHLRPLLARHRELARASLQRKIGALRAGIEAALRTRASHRGQPVTATDASDTARVEQELRAASGAFDTARRAIDQEGFVSDQRFDDALGVIVGSVADALLAGTTADATTLVTDGLVRAARQRAEAIASALTTLAGTVRVALTNAAKVLDLPEPTTGDEWASLMRELPQIDPGAIHASFTLPLLGAFGRRAAHARVRRAIEEQADAAVRTALDTHSRLLRSWGLRVFTHLRQQFDAQAQIYRAQLSGAAGRSSDDAVATALREIEDIGTPADAPRS